MKLLWLKSESTVAPEELQVCKDCIRLHKNVAQVPANEDQPSYFTYDEAVLTPAEYAQYLAEKNAANIDYLSMEMEVDL